MQAATLVRRDHSGRWGFGEEMAVVEVGFREDMLAPEIRLQ